LKDIPKTRSGIVTLSGSDPSVGPSTLIYWALSRDRLRGSPSPPPPLLRRDFFLELRPETLGVTIARGSCQFCRMDRSDSATFQKSVYFPFRSTLAPLLFPLTCKCVAELPNVSCLPPSKVIERGFSYVPSQCSINPAPSRPFRDHSVCPPNSLSFPMLRLPSSELKNV